jgi:hypothetical protein
MKKLFFEKAKSGKLLSIKFTKKKGFNRILDNSYVMKTEKNEPIRG